LFSRRHESRFTARAAILAVIGAVLVLTLAYPVQQYLAQRARIAEIQQAQAAQQKRIDALADRKAKWDDPAYVRAQARKRMQLVEPGERAYVVIPDPKATPSAPDGPAVAPGQAGSWYGQLWSSVREADAVPSRAGTR